jgi:hypothetical protein
MLLVFIAFDNIKFILLKERKKGKEKLVRGEVKK